MIRLIGPWFIILTFSVICYIAQPSREIPVITVVVKDANILNPLKNFKDANLTLYQWPVLYLELDIGKVCLISEGQGHQTNPPYYFESQKNPECSQLLCEGPPGPAVETWTRRNFLKYLSHCVYHGYGVEEITAANFTKGPLPNGIKVIGTEVTNSPPPQLLEISDPDKKLDRVLTPEANMVVHITKKDLIENTRLLVTTHSFLWPGGEGETNFCWFLRTLPAEWLMAQPNKEELAGKCKYFCPYTHGMLEGQPWDWDEEDLIGELWRCLGANLYFTEKTPLLIERNHKLGKIRFRPRNEISDELRGNEEGLENRKRVEL